MNVKSAPPLGIACVVGILSGRKVEMAIVAHGLIGFDAIASQKGGALRIILPIEEAADGQCVVAEEFCGKAVAGLLSYELLVGVFLREFRAG